MSIFLSRCSSFNWLNSPERANWAASGRRPLTLGPVEGARTA